MFLETRKNWKEPLLHGTGVMAPVVFLRFYHSSVSKHIIDLQENAKEDSKCACKIFRFEIRRINQ